MRLLLDENLPKRLKLDFPEHEIYPAVARYSRNTGMCFSKRNYFMEEILKLISFYRLPRALSLFLDKK
jgi:hypothetical protein